MTRKAKKGGLVNIPKGNSTIPNSMADAEALNSRQAALLLGVTDKTLMNWRCKKIGPPYRKCPGAKIITYGVAELRQYIESHTITPEA